MTIYIAQTENIDALLDIYTPFVAESTVTFELDTPDKTAFKNRVEAIKQTYPWLVAMDEDRVIGYAYASPYRERAAYQWMAECSVYVSKTAKRKGVARKLYHALIELLQLQGFYKLYAVITLPNEESTVFHEKMGFSWFATYKKVGYKLNKWCDVGWWEYTLKEPQEEKPNSPMPFSKMSNMHIEKILKKYNAEK